MDKVTQTEHKLKADGYVRSKDESSSSEYQFKWTKEGSVTFLVNYRFGNRGTAQIWKQQ